ncbi:MAG: DUF1016 family protein [Burkholderiales bacterium]|jgi:predicted nuclease of restriction endonuclease-like (RecB) superfamily|nr:DUF1016 family protein [Burkholderiales bacterium]
MAKQSKPAIPKSEQGAPFPVDGLLVDIRSVIAHARQQACTAVNAAQTYMYWHIGQRIHIELLCSERAPYGAQIVATLLRQLSWSHFLALLPLNKPYQRDFYAEMCRIEGWSVRTLRERIDSMLYERTALSKQPDALIQQELATLRSKNEVAPTLVLKDPYLLDFLGLSDRFLERDLEDAILRELETFLLELGSGFSFVARQKRIQLDGDDFYIDLLFYNRKLKRLVVVELKQGNFKPQYKGQMELYLRWLAKFETEADENPPLGIILCAGKNSEQIELLELGDSGIHVAEYLTVLPPPDVLHRKLHEAIETARARIEAKEDEAGWEGTA